MHYCSLIIFLNCLLLYFKINLCLIFLVFFRLVVSKSITFSLLYFLIFLSLTLFRIFLSLSFSILIFFSSYSSLFSFLLLFSYYLSFFLTCFPNRSFWNSSRGAERVENLVTSMRVPMKTYSWVSILADSERQILTKSFILEDGQLFLNSFPFSVSWNLLCFFSRPSSLKFSSRKTLKKVCKTSSFFWLKCLSCWSRKVFNGLMLLNSLQFSVNSMNINALKIKHF